MKKSKKSLVMLGTFLVGLHSKFTNATVEDVLFDDTMEALYGPPEDELKRTIISPELIPYIIIATLIITIIGISIYLNKSKASKKKKILITIICAAIGIAIIYFMFSIW